MSFYLLHYMVPSWSPASHGPKNVPCRWYSIPLVRSLVTCRGQTFQDFKTHSFCVEGNFKYSVCHISYNEKPFTVVSIYRNPDSAIGDFLNKFQKLYFQVFAQKIKTSFSVLQGILTLMFFLTVKKLRIW